MYRINKYLVTTRAYQIHGETDTDIQLDYNCLILIVYLLTQCLLLIGGVKNIAGNI